MEDVSSASLEEFGQSITIGGIFHQNKTLNGPLSVGNDLMTFDSSSSNNYRDEHVTQYVYDTTTWQKLVGVDLSLVEGQYL